MPIELESGNLQLTDEEIALYRSAAALVAKTLKEHISLHEPITPSQFTLLLSAIKIIDVRGTGYLQIE